VEPVGNGKEIFSCSVVQLFTRSVKLSTHFWKGINFSQPSTKNTHLKFIHKKDKLNKAKSAAPKKNGADGQHQLFVIVPNCQNHCKNKITVLSTSQIVF